MPLPEYTDPRLLQVAGTRLAMMLNSTTCLDHGTGECGDRTIAREIVDEIFRRYPSPPPSRFRGTPTGLVRLCTWPNCSVDARESGYCLGHEPWPPAEVKET